MVGTYLLWCPNTLSHIFAVLEHGKNPLDGRLLLLELLHLQALATPAGFLDELFERLLDELNVLEAQLLGDDVQVAERVYVTLNVNDLGIVEAAHDLENSIDGANMRQEGVSKTGTSRCTAGKTSNVIDGQVGGNARLGVVLLDQPVIALIGDNDARLFRVDSGIGKILRKSALCTLRGLRATYGGVTERALGNRLEQRRFTNVG
jgi:hypothetical protein